MIRYLIAVVGALLIVSTAKAQTPEDNKRIRLLAAEFDEAWNAHDANLLVRHMVPDAQFVTTGGRRLMGRAKIEAYHRRLFKGISSASINKTTELSVRFIKPDVALLNRRWLIRGDRYEDARLYEDARPRRYEDARPRPDRTGLMTLLTEKRMGRWLITAAHTTNTFVPRRDVNPADVSTLRSNR